jgi:small redox-active disulfide protein 2
MDIKILGKGCAKCLKLESITKETLATLGLEAQVTHVTDPNEIVTYPVMTTPALVIDGVVRCEGHLPRREDLTRWLLTH